MPFILKNDRKKNIYHKVLNPIKLARKRKKNISQKIADEFFNKHSKWRSNKSSDDMDTLHPTYYMETAQSSSNIAQNKQKAPSQQTQVNITAIQNERLQEQILTSDSKFQQKISIQSSSPDLKPSNLFSRNASESQQELGTFGIGDNTSIGKSSLEITDRPILFDQLSNALEKSDSEENYNPPNSLRTALNQENLIPQQSSTSSNQQDAEIDQLSNRIGSLLNEVKSLKIEKELKKQSTLDQDITDNSYSTEVIESKKIVGSSNQQSSSISENFEQNLGVKEQIVDYLLNYELKN